MSMTFENNVVINGKTTSKGEKVMNRMFGKETEVIAAGTFHTAKGENNMSSFRKESEVIPAGTFHKAEGGNMMKNIINIHKEAGTKKDAVRVRRESDIPDFLKEAIDVVGNKLVIDCVEGKEAADLGAVIGYEKSDVTVHGYNCWVIGNAATNLIEKNGVFYKKATVMKAMLVTDEFPEFLSGAAIRRNDDGSWTIKTSWGESTGFPGKCYWVLYGINEDGTPDANILTKTEKSFKDYIVCDEDGIDLGWLSELDEIWSTGEQKYILSPDHLRVLVTSGGAKIDRR